MKRVALALVAMISIWAVRARAEEQPQMPKPGPEHELLKSMEGTWDLTVKAMGNESKGTCTYKMGLGGLWLMSKVEGDMGGMKFEGRGMDSYDANRKKYVSVWIDSMGTSPLVSEGTYDKDTKTMTLTGDGPGMDGKMTKYKMVTVVKDDDNMTMTMTSGPEDKPQTVTIDYKRRK